MTAPVEQSSDAQALMVRRPTAGWIVLGGLVAAAMPHFFLQTPLDFYIGGRVDGWLGLTIWPATFLGAIALFIGAAPSARVDRPWGGSIDVRLAVGVVTPIAVVSGLAVLNFHGYDHIGDWTTLALAMVVYGGIFGVGTLFWQAVVEHVVLHTWPAPLRLLAVTAAGTMLWLPFLAGPTGAGAVEPAVEYGLVYFGIALIYELGLSVFGCVGVGMFLGMAYAWAHQMVFF